MEQQTTAAAGIWWIDTFTIRLGHYYRYHIDGRNDLDGGREISWSIPNLKGGGGRYAFGLRQIVGGTAQKFRAVPEQTQAGIAPTTQHPARLTAAVIVINGQAVSGPADATRIERFNGAAVLRQLPLSNLTHTAPSLKAVLLAAVPRIIGDRFVFSALLAALSAGLVFGIRIAVLPRFTKYGSLSLPTATIAAVTAITTAIRRSFMAFEFGEWPSFAAGRTPFHAAQYTMTACTIDGAGWKGVQ